jgi:hypothetical protein
MKKQSLWWLVAAWNVCVNEIKHCFSRSFSGYVCRYFQQDQAQWNHKTMHDDVQYLWLHSADCGFSPWWFKWSALNKGRNGWHLRERMGTSKSNIFDFVKASNSLGGFGTYSECRKEWYSGPAAVREVRMKETLAEVGYFSSGRMHWNSTRIHIIETNQEDQRSR